MIFLRCSTAIHPNVRSTVYIAGGITHYNSCLKNRGYAAAERHVQLIVRYPIRVEESDMEMSRLPTPVTCTCHVWAVVILYKLETCNVLYYRNIMSIQSDRLSIVRQVRRVPHSPREAGLSSVPRLRLLPTLHSSGCVSRSLRVGSPKSACTTYNIALYRDKRSVLNAWGRARSVPLSLRSH